MSNMLRITGMATGMDTDTTVKQLMKPYNMRLDKMKQDRQIVQWQQDIYREIIGDINTLKSTYFDTLTNPSTSIVNQNNFSILDASTDTTNSVSLTAGPGATSGSYSVKVDSLASAATIGDSSILNNKSNVTITGGYITNSNWSEKTIKFSIDGDTTGTGITLPTYTDPAQVNMTTLITDITNQINNNDKLKGKISVTRDGTNNTLQFNVLSSNTIKITSTGTTASEISNLDKVLAPKLSTKLSDLGITSGDIKLTANGLTTPVTVSVDSTKTIGDLVNSINTASGGTVSAKFSELSGMFTIKTAQTGSSNTLKLEAAATNPINLNVFKTALGITDTEVEGEDAIVTITPPGGTATTISKSTNNFSIDGVTYSLLNTNTTASTVSLTLNTQKAVDKIKAFVGKYNELLDKIQTKIEQKKSGYVPLTDEEKSSMKSEDITKWEEKAKEGILRNDNLLSKFLQDLRGTLYQEVKGAGISLSDSLGFGTTPDTTKRGQLVLDENKLKTALQNNGEQIMRLFTKASESKPSYNRTMSNTDKNTRISEEGIFQRLKDVLEDYSSTMYRDSNGKKGYLIQKSGLKGDLSELSNLYYDSLKDKDKLISAMQSKISSKEDQYYNQFAKLESAMNQMNAQQSWLASQLGGN